MEELVAAGAPWPGAVAVSGGGDSIALMHLLARWARDTGRAPPQVITVDHGLRASSASEARKVSAWAKRAGLVVQSLRWTGPRPKADVEAAAREARYRLMGEHARRKKLAALYVGHTRDDQVETFLLRLMRGSGLDGLAAMRALAPYPLSGFRDLCVVRPLLGLEREAVRAHLLAGRHAWLEDPMNEEERFARVRLRRLLPQLEAAGLTRARIAAAAGHLTRAREALETVTAAVLARAVRRVGDTIHLDAAALAAAPREVGLRALAQLLMIVSGQSYRPRFERLERLFERVCAQEIGRGVTLHGCKLATALPNEGAFGVGTLVVSREFAPTKRSEKRMPRRKAAIGMR